MLNQGRPQLIVASGILLCLGSTAGMMAQISQGRPPANLRLYVLDCGYVRNIDTWSAFGFDPNKIANTTDAACPCHLIVHPKGTLVWDAGTVPDDEIGKENVRPAQPGRRPTTFIATKPLRQQLS